MNNILTYKGYIAKVEFSSEDLKLFGKIDGIRDLVTFESVDAETIEQEFHNAVDDYLAYCADMGKKPDKPFKGSFNVRISPELHKAAVIKATEEGKSLNVLVTEALEKYMGKSVVHFTT